MKKYLVRENINLTEALQKITINRDRHVIVVNNKGIAVGILSDGDIRRAILKKNKLTTKISKIYNKNLRKWKN